MDRTPPGLAKILGPGILMAAAAIGTSHLVQSTRAGASFGFQLLWLAVLANVMKYPFFEFGQRYGAATGETLLHGYRKLGRAYLLVFLLISCVTMVTSISALVFVTAALAQNLFGLELGEHSATWWSLITVLVCNAVLARGRYRILDRVTKVIVAVLGVTTVVAAVAAFINRPELPADFEPSDPWTLASLTFLLALMGWMPGPIELSVWPSVWMRERAAQTGYRPTMREALIDFNTGYVATIVLSVAFLGLGALVMYPTGQEFDPRGPVFARQLVDLFQNSIGVWIGPVVAVAAFTTIFSTTLTVLDGYPRSNGLGVLLALGRPERRLGPVYWSLNIGSSVLALLVVTSFARNIKTMVDVATIVAFLAAPLLAFLNIRLILSEHVPREHRPRVWLIALAWLGLLFLLGFGVLYLVHRLGLLTSTAI